MKALMKIAVSKWEAAAEIAYRTSGKKFRDGKVPNTMRSAAMGGLMGGLMGGYAGGLPGAIAGAGAGALGMAGLVHGSKKEQDEARSLGERTKNLSLKQLHELAKDVR